MIPSWMERALERLRVFLRTGRIASWLVGLLLGFFINLTTDSAVKTPYDFLNILWSGRLSSILFLSSLAFLLLIEVMQWALEKHRISRGDDACLIKFLARHVDSIIAPYANGEIAMGSALTLQHAPDLTSGWHLRDVQVKYEGDNLTLPADLKDAYKAYFDANYIAKRFNDDGGKLCITENPTSLTDSPTLVLKVEKTVYSKVQFYRDCVATVESSRSGLIREAVEDTSIRFPHAFCMHAVVVTRDSKVLLTRRSPKVSYYPNAWSVSLEEQFSEVDLLPRCEGAVLRWAIRFLDEELSVEEEHYDEQNLRALSVFLEADILNCSLATVLKLSIDSTELDQIIRGRPRKDTEFGEWEFVTYAELAKDLLETKRNWHPTSKYRMLLFLNHVQGAPKLARLLFRSQA